MKKIRYRDTAQGITRKSLVAASRNLHKVGYINSIMGYRVNGTEYVMVKGNRGTARFSGLCWSYSGEGPRGLAQILRACGIPIDGAIWLAYNLRRNFKNAKGAHWFIPANGTDWIIPLHCGQMPQSHLINPDH